MAILWFTKSRRAQNDTDYETWIAGGVSPTLNAFDNATETRATILIIDGTRVGDVRVYEDDVMQTVIKRWGTGGGNVPYVYPIQGTVIGRSDTAGPQGKGFGEDGDPMYTIDTVGGHGVAVYPIQDGREVEKKQNGIGVGDDGSPAYTVDTLATQGVAIGFSHTQGLSAQPSEEAFPTLRTEGGGMAVAYSFDSVSSNSMKSSNPDSGCREIDVCKTVDTAALNPSANQGGVAVAVSYDEYNDSLGGDIHQSTGAIVGSVVRRLTPTECERLQGFPDDWTEQRYDYKKQQVVDQADSNRYKQMGNAVAVPVVSWIISRLVEADNDDRQT